MKLIFSLIFTWLICANSFSQLNVINNNSFEVFTNCPRIPNARPPLPWFIPTNNNPTYLNACANNNISGVPFNALGFQYPKTGNAYLYLDYLNSIGDNIRTYVQVPLKDSLIADKCYYGEYYINLPNPLKNGCNNIAMLFTKNKVYVDTTATPFGVLAANPQIVNYSNPIMGDTLLWQKVSGVFVAQGGEKYLTLGNFKYDNETQYAAIQATGQNNKLGYYIDDVAVYPLDSITLKADAGADKNITLGDSTFIGSYTNGLTGVRWFNNLGQELTNKAGIPGFFVKPLVSTFYVIEQNVCGQYSRDTVNVNVSAMPLRFMMYDVRFTNMNGSQFPSFGGVRGGLIENKWSTSNEVNVSHFNIQRSENGINFRTIAKLFAKNNIINDYAFEYSSPPLEGLGAVYFRIEAVDFDGKKNYSQIRSISPSIGEVRGGFIIYPNPTRDYVTIQSKEKIREVKIINQLGQIVKVETINHTSCIINCTSLHKGIYTLLISTQKGDNYNKKLLIK